MKDKTVPYAVAIQLVTMPLWFYVVQTLWLWHMTPLGLEPLSYWNAAGVSIAVHYPLLSLARTPFGDDRAAISRTVSGVITRLMFWGFGWLVHVVGT